MPLAMLAQTNHWTPQSSGFENNMTLTGVIQINGVEQQSTALEVGAFCGTECRGSALPMLFPVTGRYVVFLTIFGGGGDQFTFKLYDHNQGMELNLQSPNAVTFNPDGLGSVGNPYVLNFTAVNYTISASASPTAGGSVSGAGAYQSGSTCTLTATPNTGYNFVRWTKNGTQVSSSASYSFTVTENASYVAVFSLKNYTISASANPTAGGSVSGGGTYNHGSTCTLTATANIGYTFTNWTKNGLVVSTSASYSFTVTSSGTYVANFSQNTYTISASASPTAGGTVSGGGTYNYGNTCTLTATANTGYTFTNWTKNGTQVSTNETYTFTVTESASYVANFEEEGATCGIIFDLYDSWGDGWNGNKLAVTYNGSEYAEITLESGSSGTQTLMIEDGSHVTLTWITGNYIGECSFTVSYSNGNMIYYGANLSGSFVYEFDVDCIGMPVFTCDVVVLANIAVGGTVSGGGEYGLGSTCTVTAIANVGYTFMYWTENGQHVSSEASYSFIVTGGRNLVAVFSETNGSGLLSGTFTVGENVQVHFAKGNLLYQASTGIWRFAENQYDCMSSGNVNASSTYSGWIDLYCWGTSGWDSGAQEYQPYAISTSNNSYLTGGSSSVSLTGDYADADWAYHNAIVNGGQQSGLWRCLTHEEYIYLMESRADASQKYAYANVNGINGLVILPDTWTLPDGLSFVPQAGSWNSNVYSAEQWIQMESAGAVFLPATGTRQGNSVFYVGGLGDYWSSTACDESTGHSMSFFNGNVYPGDTRYRCLGTSVRPVQVIQYASFTIQTSANPTVGGTVSGAGTYNYGSTCTLTATPSTGYTFTNWTENGEVVSTEATYSFTVTGNRDLVANFGQNASGPTLLSDDFNDGVIDPELWTYTGNAVLEEDGLLKLQQNVTDQDVHLRSIDLQIPENGKVIMDRRFMVHHSYNYYNGRNTIRLNDDSNSFIQIEYVYTLYYDNAYHNDPKTGIYLITKLNGVVSEVRLCDINFDTWLTEHVEVDFVAGTLSYYMDTFVATVMISGLAEQTVNHYNVEYGPYGWWTGHQHYIDYVNINVENMFLLASLSDDFNDDVIAPELWLATGNNVYEEDGLLKMEQNITDQNVSLLSKPMSVGIDNKIVVERRFKVHRNYDYYYGAFAIEFNGDTEVHNFPHSGAWESTISNTQLSEYYLTFIYTYDNYLDNYGIYFEAGMGDQAHGIRLCDAIFDTWLTEMTIVDLTAGIVTYYLNDDYVATVEVPELTTLSVNYYTTIFRPYGWWTGHQHYMDYINIFAPESSSNITATAEPADGGTVAGGGTFDYGQTCTLTATANAGYTFVNWTENGVVVSTEAIYSFTVARDRDLVANFVEGSVIMVGDGGEATNQYLPSYSFFNFSLTQQIYTADEIGTDGFITNIAFYNGGTGKTRSYDVYMVHTDKNTFDSNTDWIAVTEADRVFSGTVSMIANAWTTLQFDTPYAYNGVSNLAIIVDDNSGNWTGSPHMACRVFDANGNQAIRVYSDGTNYDPYNPSGYGGTLHSVKNQIRLGMIPYELTVHEGTTTNSYVPVYGLYTDAYLKSEFIMPASELTQMAGFSINRMKFYASQTNVSWGNARFQVFMKEVDDTSINSYSGFEGATVVYEGSLNISDGMMDVVFAVPYQYGGGNLLIGFYEPATGSYVSSHWYGETVDGASVQGKSFNSLEDVDCNQRNFLPKTTFYYQVPDSYQQSFALASGWNWFSSYVEAGNLLQQLEESLGENGVSIESRNDGMTEFDGEDWFGDLDDVGITNEQMYLIQTSAACTIQLNGIPANAASHPITINPGWNWIGFPCSHEVSIADAFAGFEAEEGDQLESKAGYTEFDGEDWFGEIETLTPGQGYLYYSNSAVPKTLIFQMSRKR
jgi:hypothetical protein